MTQYDVSDALESPASMIVPNIPRMEGYLAAGLPQLKSDLKLIEEAGFVSQRSLRETCIDV
jgi:hypothetical protein